MYRFSPENYQVMLSKIFKIHTSSRQPTEWPCRLYDDLPHHEGPSRGGDAQTTHRYPWLGQTRANQSETVAVYWVEREKTYLGAKSNLPPNDGDNKDRDANIRGDETSRGPVPLEEDRESSHQRDNDRSDGSIPGCVGHPWGLPRESVTADALDFEGTVESDVADTECSPSDETSDCAEVEKPGESLGGTATTKT